MSTPHNKATKEDIAKIVIMPGDPLRAKYIAEKYLKEYKLVNDVRGMYAYTGFYNNKKITIMAHGMGNPSIGIYAYELFKFYDVDEIIRIGSCGTFINDIKLRSIVLAEKSYSKSSFAKVHSNDSSNFFSSNNELNIKIENVAKKLNINLYKTNVYNTDVFYEEKENYNELYNKYKCTMVEMESFALFYLAKKLNKKAACLLTVSDNISTKEALSSGERQTSFDEMIKLSLESI